MNGKTQSQLAPEDQPGCLPPFLSPCSQPIPTSPKAAITPRPGKRSPQDLELHVHREGQQAGAGNSGHLPSHDPAIAPVPGRPGWFPGSTERAVFVGPPVTAPDTAVFTVPALAQGPTSCSSWKEAGGKTPRCWGSSLSERWARSLARIVQSAVRTVRVAARFLTVRAQAFKQVPEERFVSCQACCPVGVGFGHEPLGILLEPCSVSRVVTKGHCLLPASSGLIVQRAGKVGEAEVERTWRKA